MSVLLVTAMIPATLATTEDTAPAALLPMTDALASGAWGDAFREMARARDVPVPDVPVVDDSAHALMLMSRGTLDREGAEAILGRASPELRPGMDTLLIGMAQADALVQDELAKHPDTAIQSARERGAGWRGIGVNHETDAAPTFTLPEVEGLDEGTFHLAQAILLDAVQAAVPLFAAADTTQGVVLDERPYVLVYDSGDDMLGPADNAILIVDIGGNDRYDNAQGTPFTAGGVRLPQVIVDLDGNDAYERTATATSGLAEVVAQGAGVLGVGGILDAGGNDRYVAVARHLPWKGEPVQADVVAQGAGVLGAGFLVDLGGFDCVHAAATSHGAPALVAAQGAGTLGAGFAALLGGPVDGGECRGSPTAEARAEPLVLRNDGGTYVARLGPAEVVAQGAGLLGGGAFVGGIAQRTYDAVAEGGLSLTAAQGAGVLGAGAFVAMGSGNAYRTSASSEAALGIDHEGSYSRVRSETSISLGDTLAVGQGAGAAGVGAFAETGFAGSTSLVEARTRAEAFARAVTTYSGGSASASATVIVGDTLAYGHGAADVGAGLHTTTSAGTALNLEAAHERTVTSALDVVSTAVADGGVRPQADAVTVTGDAVAGGQGHGQLGSGTLLSVGTSDHYTLDAHLSAAAHAYAGEGGTSSTSLTQGIPRAAGQGEGTTGAGTLVDVDGHDTYTRLPGGTSAGNDRCYTNSPTGLLNIGAGADLGLTAPSFPGSCVLPPWV